MILNRVLKAMLLFFDQKRFRGYMPLQGKLILLIIWTFAKADVYWKVLSLLNLNTTYQFFECFTVKN